MVGKVRRPDRLANRGFTLIEMIVVMTAGAILLGIAVGMLHLLMRTEQTGRDRVGRTAAFAQLAEQFRTDAAAALQFEPDRRRFILPDQREATYQTVGATMDREERKDGRLLRRESFALTAGSSVTFKLDRRDAASWASLTVGVGESPSQRETCVVALLGKDRRFVQPAKKGR
ncbi:MAG: prepilin-type N-terminal cleavage/methylation domain-containing protein [Thermoguttaceae bacterium]